MLVAEIENRLVNAVENADKEAVCGPNGLQLSCPPFDEIDVIVVLHDEFITVASDGESETFKVADGLTKPAELVVYFVEQLGAA